MEDKSDSSEESPETTELVKVNEDILNEFSKNVEDKNSKIFVASIE